MVNEKTLGAGVLIGFLATFLFIGGAQLTGFAVNVGADTINFDQTVTSDTVIPLTIPRNLTSFSVTGRYTGSGSASMHLVGPNQTWHIATWQAPRKNQTDTFLLDKGGVLVQINENNVSYEHVFQEACDETCNESMRGPYYLQLHVKSGSLRLASATYESPELFSAPETPPERNETVNVTIPEPPEQRENPPPQCSADSDCADGLVCESSYCISETGHFNITDKDGRLVALIDKHGTVLLAGRLIENSDNTPPANAFRVDAGQQSVAWITDQGDLHLSGTLSEEVQSVPVSGPDNFIVRNETENVCVVQGATGSMYTKSVLAEGVLP